MLIASPDEITKTISILLHASKYKKFHASLAYTFLFEIMQRLSAEEFLESAWPLLKKELKRPWEKHTINTIYCLLTIQDRYPNLVTPEFLEKSLKTNEILSPVAYKHIGRLFWGNQSAGAITHPAYDALGKFLQTINAKNIGKFWHSEISETLAAPNKIKEVVTLKIFTDLLSGQSLIDHPSIVVKMLNKRFIKMCVSSLKHLKSQRHTYVSAFYDEFFEAFSNYFDRIVHNDENDAKKVEMILKFIDSSTNGTIMIEKYTTNKIIHQLTSKLDANGIAKMCTFYRQCILAGTQTKTIVNDESSPSSLYTHMEKQHAAQMIQHLLNLKTARTNTEWLCEQLKFLFTIGMLHTNATGEATKKNHDTGLITKDLANTVKSAFFASLQSKQINLSAEKQLLYNVAEYINEMLSNKSAAKYFRDTLTDKHLSAWNKMYETVSKSTAKDTKLTQTFHILFLHMGFQLFREQHMAQIALDDLYKCLENTKKKKRSSIATQQNDEPEWIEVVVDLFLHLMSQNVNFLRHVVDSIFPNFCENLNMTAVHQILSVLDMADGKNPLSRSSKNNGDDDAENDNESSSEDDDDDDGDNDESAINEDEEDDKSSVDSMDDEEEGKFITLQFTPINDKAGEYPTSILCHCSVYLQKTKKLIIFTGTVPEQLRNAISLALGSAAPETDTESIDLNDMTDADAIRLDTALSAAFQINKKPNSKKKTKEERESQITVMHFRIRVLDLIEIYLKTSSSLAISLEIIFALFALIEHSSGDKDLQILTVKVDRILKKFLGIRKFDDISDVTEDTLTVMLKSLIDKRVNLITIENHNQRLSKFYQFIINAAMLLQQQNSANTVQLPVLQLTQDYLNDFIKSRNPIIAFNLLQDIFKGRWLSIWDMGKLLAKTALQLSVRSFRRAQSMDLLALLYKNHGFIHQEIEQFNKITKKIEKSIQKYMDAIENNENLSAKEFSSFVALLLEIFKCHKIGSVHASIFDWKLIGDRIQIMRQRVILVSIQSYANLCRCLSIKIHKNVVAAKKINVDNSNGEVMQNGNTDQTVNGNGEQVDEKINLKRKKAIESQSKKEKRLKKEERLRISSEGFNGVTFS